MIGTALLTYRGYVPPETASNLIIAENVSYQGQIRDKKMDGVGTLTKKNEYTITGEFKEGVLDESKKVFMRLNDSLDTFEGYLRLDEEYSYYLIEGTYKERKSNRTYSGKFQDNLYSDENGTYYFSDSSRYEGAFVEGTNVSQTGTIYYAPYDSRSTGVWAFRGTMETEQTFVADQEGKGIIKYPDYSIYSGDLYYDGTSFLRKGVGEMDFSECSFLGGNAGFDNHTRLSKYVGEFDYDRSGWMYGNGVLYFTDLNDGLPKAWIKGFFNGLSAIGVYRGGAIELEEGYSEEMEKPFIFNKAYAEEYRNRYYYAETPRSVVIAGDSYTDMMHKKYNIIDFEEKFPILYDAIDTGIGGTTYYQWRALAETLIVPYSPKKIVLHLGFNDLHLGLTPSEAVDDAAALVAYLKEQLADSEIYLMSVEPSPCFASFLGVETEFNRLIEEYCISNGIGFIDHAALLMKNETETIDDLADYFIGDQIHLNQIGYETFVSMIQSVL